MFIKIHLTWLELDQFCLQAEPNNLGVDIINGQYPPGVFFQGSQIFGQENKESQIFRGKSKGSQINFIDLPKVFQNLHFLRSYRSKYRKIRYNFRNQKSR